MFFFLEGMEDGMEDGFGIWANDEKIVLNHVFNTFLWVFYRPAAGTK